MPKTIAILAPSGVPFEVGGAEKFWWGLRNALAVWSGAFVELIKLPCREKSFADLLDTYETFARLDLSHFDMLVSTKYPAWMANHPNHVCYMQHTLRGLYDTYAYTGLPEILAHAPAKLDPLLQLVRKPHPDREDLPICLDLARGALSDASLPPDIFRFPGPLIREIIHFFDRVALAPGQIKSYLAISHNVASRKDYFPANIDIKILPHPSDLEHFSCKEGKYFFTASRLHSNKRVRLIADAMRHVPLDVSLKIAGTGPELAMLKQRFAADPRIEFLGYVPDDELIDLYAGAICVPYVPLDEDYGLITIEAMKSGKPVITTPDSGGVCEFVRQGETGFIVNPYPPDMAEAMTRLAKDPSLAQRLGNAARESVARINWRANVEEFLQHCNDQKSHVLVCAPFAANRYGAGGPRRLYHFCAALAKNFAVRLIAYGSQSQNSPVTGDVDGLFTQTTLPWPKKILDAASEIAAQTGQSSDDIALARHCCDDAQLLAALSGACANASAVVVSHPWLYPALARVAPNLPLLYDAHNVEADMKKDVYGQSDYAKEACALERRVCHLAQAIFACSHANAQRLAQLYGIKGEKIAIAPNGCELPPDSWSGADAATRLAFPDEKIVIFIGSDHRPNVDAALAIFDMAPRLPQAQFLILGSVCYPPRVARIPRPANLHLLGPVSEKVKVVLLARANLALNPVCSGSGVNLKIMEYLAWRIPCLSTPFGARGLPAGLEPALQLAELQDFSQKIQEMLHHPPDRQALEAAAAKIAAACNWRAVFSGLATRVEALCRQDGTGAVAH